jgi:hypothetical protein
VGGLLHLLPLLVQLLEGVLRNALRLGHHLCGAQDGGRLSLGWITSGMSHSQTAVTVL